jgi:hypothetical protein
MLVIIVLLWSTGNGRVKFRSGIFLHHSTGACIWGPNGSSRSVPNEISRYNKTHGFKRTNVVTLDEQWWPLNDNDDNEWYRWHRIFSNMDTVNADIRPILAANKIVMIKSCFPSSDIEGVAVPSDTLTWTSKTMVNYKWHWRKIVEVMKQHPSNFFVIWTNAPLVVSADDRARFADEFCRWAKDTLAAGLDAGFGPFPKNVYVFDFFHKLAGAYGKLPLTFAVDGTDSHPNADATALVAPALVQEVFDAALNYEN